MGSKFWALWGLNQNQRTTFCRGGHRELTAKKWRFHRETIKKNQFEVCDRQTETDGRTDRVNEKNNRLLARHGDQ